MFDNITGEFLEEIIATAQSSFSEMKMIRRILNLPVNNDPFDLG
jgi:hypothetical protein